MKTRLALLLATSFLTVAPAARGSGMHDGIGFTPRFHGFDPDQVTFDTSADGALWGGGAKYKARFTRGGAEYMPYLGSSAPRHFPVAFELASARVGRVAVQVANGVPPARTGRKITYDRGGVVEQYVLDSGSMEQSFVFPDLPCSGELVVRIGVATELSPSATDDGLVFSNELGSVRYGRAQAIDARGLRVDAPTTWEGDSIEIHVPQSFVDVAVFPLTIDPVVSTFAPGASYNFTLLPDIAFDAANGVYMVSYEHEIWGGDHDIYTELYDTSGAYVPNSFVAIDMTTEYWQVARCAENAQSQQFYVAAVVGNHGDGSGYIAGRTRAANANTAGSIFVVDTGEPDIYLDVGGDPDPIRPGNFLVVWEAKTTVTDHNIFARLVDAATGMPLGTNITIDNSAATLDEHPNVSKCDGRAPDALQDWTIVWSRENTPTDHDIFGAQIHWDGTITNSAYGITFGASDDTYPQVSSPLDGTGSRKSMIVFQRDAGGGSHDIQGVVFDGPFFFAQADLSTLEGSAFSGQDQIHPSVDSDGAAFAVAYSEQVGSSTVDYDIRISTFSLLGTTIQMAERHGQLVATVDTDDFPQVSSNYSGNGGRFRFAIVSRTFASNVCYGALYDADTFASFCFPGVDGVAPCPCANPGILGHGCDNSAATGGAILTKTGTGSLSADTVVFTTHGEKATALSIVLQGTSVATAGQVYGQGIRCVAGGLKRLYAKAASAGSITAPGSGDPSVSSRSAAKGDTIDAGSTRYYLVYYRDPTVLGGCPPTSTFNATQSGSICWRP
jgi:hypothetical protein